MNWLEKIFPRTNTDTGKTPPIPRAFAAQTGETAAIKPTRPLIECEQNLTVEQLKRFAPLRDLDEQTLTNLPHVMALYPRDATVFIRGQSSDAVYYLMAGQLQMQPDSEDSYQVKEGTGLAALPLNSGKSFGATAMALTEVSILKISADLNRLWTHQRQENLSCIELVDLELPEEISNQHFFNSFAHAYRENRLRLPSLPNVAFKLQRAMLQDIGIHDAVEIIQVDPAIVAKLIQVANCPLYATTVAINNCHDAVNRIGLDATRNLVLSISIKQLFNSKDRELLKGMQKLWKNSLYVSSLCFVLAQECSDIPPEDALLAGLICDIGAIPLLHFAEQFPEHYPDLAELETAFPYLRGPVGYLVLHTLGFSANLCNIPNLAEDWHHDSGDCLGIADIVILAKLHSYFGNQQARDLPYINSIPAYAKISEGKLDPDFSLAILRKAHDRIDAVMRLLS